MNNQQIFFNFLTANSHAIKHHPDSELIKKFTVVCNELARKLDAAELKIKELEREN